MHRKRTIVLALTLMSVQAVAEDAKLNGIEALLDVGRSLKRPLGIVCDDRKTLQNAKIAYYDGMTYREIVAQLPQYDIRDTEGVTIVRPLAIPERTARIINTAVGDFHSGPATFAQMGATLWMDVVVANAEHKPQTFMGVINGNDSIASNSGLSLHDATVENVLNAIIRSSAGAAWIILPPTKKPLENTQQDDLWNFVRFGSSDVSTPIRSVCCVSWDVLSP